MLLYRLIEDLIVEGRNDLLIPGDAVGLLKSPNFLRLLMKEFGPIMDVKFADQVWCEIIHAAGGKQYLILCISVPENYSGRMSHDLGKVKLKPDVGWLVDRDVLVNGIDHLISQIKEKRKTKLESLDSAGHSYEKHSARRETSMRRFYDGISAQDNVTVENENDEQVSVPVVKSMSDFVKNTRQFKTQRYYMNREQESDGGVVFLDGNRKVVAYSPPQWYFGGSAGYLA